MKNSELIDDALREINVINENGNASGEQSTQSLRKLNQMMEQWKLQNIDFGWFKQSDLTATAPVPNWAEQAIVTGLAIRLAPQYGASISGELAAVFNDSIKTVRRELMQRDMDGADMSHMAQGDGRLNSRYDITRDV